MGPRNGHRQDISHRVADQRVEVEQQVAVEEEILPVDLEVRASQVPVPSPHQENQDQKGRATRVIVRQ